MKSRILIVEDEQNVLEALRDYLQREGFQVFSATNVAEAKRVDLSAIELVVLDWMLPDGRGVDLLRDWRSRGARVPIIMLTARAELIDKVLGLELGADDYLTKPFEPRELLARIHARLRAFEPHRPVRKILQVGELAIDRDAHQVSFQGRPIELTRMEYKLLELLMENPNRVFSRDELLNKVWGFENYPSTRTVDTHILQLRQKLSVDLLETVRGTGYRLVVKVDG